MFKRFAPRIGKDYVSTQQNEESEIGSLRRKQDQSAQGANDANGQTLTQGEGHQNGNQYGRATRTLCQGGGKSGDSSSARDTIAGGMLRQLIDEYKELISTKQSEIDRLQNRVTHFEGLLADLNQRVAANPRND